MGLASNEGLGVSVRGMRTGCICMPAILLAAPRYGKSSRGTPRLRPHPRTLHGAPRLAARTTTLNSGPRLLAPAQRRRTVATFHLILPSPDRPARSALQRCSIHSTPWRHPSCVRTGRRSHRPQTEIRLFVPPGLLGCLELPHLAEAVSRGLAASWLFSSRRQAHFLLAQPMAVFLGRLKVEVQRRRCDRI